LLNKLEESLTFIVIQIYNLVVNNLDINTFKKSFTKNNDKLILFNTISINIYNLNIESKNSIIQNKLMQRIRTIYLYNTILQVIIKTKINNNCQISYALIKKSYRIELNKCEVINNILYF